MKVWRISHPCPPSKVSVVIDHRHEYKTRRANLHSISCRLTRAPISPSLVGHFAMLTMLTDRSRYPSLRPRPRVTILLMPHKTEGVRVPRVTVAPQSGPQPAALTSQLCRSRMHIHSPDMTRWPTVQYAPCATKKQGWLRTHFKVFPPDCHHAVAE